MLMMSLADKKKCFLKDLDSVPASEFRYWLAFYEMQADAEKKASKGR
jgi:hypothetical protein